MRRAILAAVLGLFLVPAGSQAGEPLNFGAPYDGVTGNRFHGAPAGGVSPGYSNYGRRLRGGFGRNGFAPVFGPMWGPSAFLPAAGKAGIGSYGRSEVMVATDAELPQPKEEVAPIAPPAVPKHPPVVDAPELK